MDKTGIGDLDNFAFWNSLAGLSLIVYFLLWVIAIVFALLARQQRSFSSAGQYWKSLIPDVLLPPLVLAGSWLAYLTLA